MKFCPAGVVCNTWLKPGSTGEPPHQSGVRSRIALFKGSPKVTRKPASEKARAFCVTTAVLVGITLAGNVPGGAVATLHAWPSTRMAAFTRSVGRLSTEDGSTIVSGDIGVPLAYTPRVKLRVPVVPFCVSKFR